MEGANRDSNFNCGRARERGKINRPGQNTLQAVCRTKEELSDPREELAGCRLAHPLQEAGGRRQGGGERGKLGPRDGIPNQTANRLPVSNQRLPEILDD